MNICSIQRFLRRNDTDSFSGYKSLQYGRSTSNQRIEAWWAILKRDTLSTWINYFRDLRDQGLYDDSNPMNIACLRFCFIGVLQAELDKTKEYWNNHNIRKNRLSEAPGGRPVILYTVPSIIGSQDYGMKVSDFDIRNLKTAFTRSPQHFGCSKEFLELASILMYENS